MLLHVSLRRFLGVMRGVNRVPPCAVCMMGRFLVVSALVMLGCFGVVTRGLRMVLCGVLMVLGCFLGHSDASSVRLTVA